MTRRYIFDGMSSALKALVWPSFKAPVPTAAPMQNRPGQSITTVPFPRDQLDLSRSGLSVAMNTREVVQTLPTFQPAYIPRAPKTPVGQKTEGITDSRLVQYYPRNMARESYDFGTKQAPARLQSVPGYLVKQTTITRSSPGYPTQALRAPKPRTGGGQCDG